MIGVVSNPEVFGGFLIPQHVAIIEATPFAGMRLIVPRIAHFLPFARAAGMTVVHLKSEFCANMEDAGRPGSRTRQMMNGLGDNGATENPFIHGRPTADIVPELTPQSFDVVVTKTRFSGFWGTNLNEVLRVRNIESLVFTGGTTTVCVESTLRDAMFLEYNSLALSDCTADLNHGLHESALARIELFFGWVCSSQELIGALETIGGKSLGAPVA